MRHTLSHFFIQNLQKFVKDYSEEEAKAYSISRWTISGKESILVIRINTQGGLL